MAKPCLPRRVSHDTCSLVTNRGGGLSALISTPIPIRQGGGFKETAKTRRQNAQKVQKVGCVYEYMQHAMPIGRDRGQIRVRVWMTHFQPGMAWRAACASARAPRGRATGKAKASTRLILALLLLLLLSLPLPLAPVPRPLTAASRQQQQQATLLPKVLRLPATPQQAWCRSYNIQPSELGHLMICFSKIAYDPRAILVEKQVLGSGQTYMEHGNGRQHCCPDAAVLRLAPSQHHNACRARHSRTSSKPPTKLLGLA